MGKRHTIVNRKTAGDAAKGKIYAKIGKLITIAAQKGADPDLNPSLALALQKARQHSLPKDVVEKAIKKGSGQLESVNYSQVDYEGYGPGGVAIYINASTDNTNRASGNIRILLQKYGGNLGQTGSVSWQFHQKGIVIIDGLSRREKVKGNDTEFVDPFDKEKMEEDAFGYDIEDIEFDENLCIVTTTKDQYHQILNGLQDMGYHIVESDLKYIPENTVSLDDTEKEKCLTLIELLEDDDDVDRVSHNLQE